MINTLQLADRLQYPACKQGMQMLHFLRKLLMFRVGQKASRGFAKSIGLRGISNAVGIVGGLKYMRRHS